MSDIHRAIQAGNIDAVVLRDDNINSKDPVNGSTPLICVCTYSKETIVRLLLKNGADIHVQDNDGMIAYDWAMMKGNVNSAITKLMDEAHGIVTTSINHLNPGYGNKDRLVLPDWVILIQFVANLHTE